MEYNKDTMADGTVYERYEGTPEEITKLLNIMPEEIELECDQAALIDYINNEIMDKVKMNGIFAVFEDYKSVIVEVLRLEQEFMRSIVK